jgi:uncharacterized repeat protein (TIGR02543 family)
MKKGILAILTVLTVFALVLTGCPSPGTPKPNPPKLYTVTFDGNGNTGGDVPAPITQKTEGGSITLPTKGSGAKTLVKTGFDFKGWINEDDEDDTVHNASSKYTPEDDVTLYAVWTPAGSGGTYTVTFNANGGTGTQAPITQPTAGAAITLPTAANTTLTAPSGKSLDGWSLTTTGAKLGATYTPTADTELFAVWKDGEGPAPKPPLSEHFEETVELINGNVAAYYFVLPSGKTFADYDGIEADFKVDATTFEAENRVRGGPRLYGNYPLNYLKLVEVTEANPLTPKFFAASLGSGEGEWNNGNLILDNGFLGGDWGPIASGNSGKSLYDKMMAANIPEEKLPQADEWFTVPYWTDATKANGDYNKLNGGFDGTVQAGLRNPSGAGPFIFGLGLTGQSNPTKAQVRDVRLVGKTAGTGDVLGKPLYIKAENVEYPAFVSYTSDSGNGVAGIRRTHVSGVKAVLDKPTEVVLPQYTVTFDLNKPTAASGTPVFATPESFSGSVSIKQGFNVGVSPTATLTDYNFKGWVETATGTAPIAGVEGKKVYAAKTLYACWQLASEDIPNAAADKDITATVKTTRFGNTSHVGPEPSAGLGPFEFKNTDAYQGMVWFALTADVETAVYAKVEVKYTAVALEDSDGTKPRKMKFVNGRGDDSWSGGTEGYDDAADDTEKTYTFTINDLTKSAGIQIGHNKGDASCDFAFTITKITLLKP